MVGRQGTITVGIGNTRYPENVQVELYKVTPQGELLIGTGIQTVRVMKLKQVVTFTFNYVFTSDDFTIGKVPFKAVATIQDHEMRRAATTSRHHHRRSSPSS